MTTTFDHTLTADAEPLFSDGQAGHFLSIVAAPDPQMQGCSFVIESRTVLGRATGDTGLSLSDRRLSRRHFSVRMCKAALEIADLDSKNGTSVDGQPISCQPLHTGQLIRAGNTLILVTQQATALSLKTPIDGIPGRTTAWLELCRHLSHTPPKTPLLLSGDATHSAQYLAAHLHQANTTDGGTCVCVDASAPDERAPEAWFKAAGAAGTILISNADQLSKNAAETLARQLKTPGVARIICTISSSNTLLPALDAHFQERLTLPALEARRADIPELFCAFSGRTLDAFSTGFLEGLLLYPWPGGETELEHLAQSIPSSNSPLERAELPDIIKTHLSSLEHSEADDIDELRSWLHTRDPEGTAFVIDPVGLRVRPPRADTWVSLKRRGQLMRVITFLAGERRRSPGQPVGVLNIFEAAWEEHNIDANSAQNRVYKSLSLLRKYGIGDLLLSNEGYCFDPDVPLIVVPSFS